MFPYRSLFRLLVTLSLLCLSLVLALVAVFSVLASSGANSDEYFEGRAYYGADLMGEECFYADDVESFSSRILKEFEYKEKLEQLSEAQLTNLSGLLHRDIAIQWSKRELLPPPKPLYHINCLDYLDIDYNVRVSVVIPYHNELAVLLLRTLTTIQHRTLPKYLKEIILIDDKSSVNITEEVLQYAREQKMELVMLHNEEQMGIANSRLKGIEAAKGDVVVILDSHMEVNEVWLEPLLNTITSHPKAIAVPCIHMISELEYAENDNKLCAPFVVQAQKGFGIITMTDLHENVVRADWEHFPSSAMLGGALVAYRSTLLEYYPEGLLSKSWSIENVRLSLRAWMCGDGIWVNACSQVLHANGNDVFLSRYASQNRDKHGLNLFDTLVSESISEILNFIADDDGKTTLISKFTTEEDYTEYIQDNADEIRSSFDPDQHECKDYEFYKTQVFQDYLSWERDQFAVVGEVQSAADPQMCLEVLNYVIAPYPCRGHPAGIFDTHLVGFTKNECARCGDIDHHCWDTSTYEERSLVKLYGCHVRSAVEGEPYDSQRFAYNASTQQIVHAPSDRCLEYIDAQTAWLMRCDGESVAQRWNIKQSVWF